MMGRRLNTLLDTQQTRDVDPMLGIGQRLVLAGYARPMCSAMLCSTKYRKFDSLQVLLMIEMRHILNDT